MYAPRLRFGKYAGEPIDSDRVPRSYLSWLLGSCDRLEPWFRSQVKAELYRRGERFVSARLVLDDIEETLTAMIAEDEALPHAVAGLVSDCVLLTFEQIRERYHLGEETELHVPARREERWGRTG